MLSNAISDRPKLVMFSSWGYKHSVRNIERTGAFTVSFVSAALADQMNASSAAVDFEVDEFAHSGATPRMGRLVDAPFVAEAPAALECRLTEIVSPKTLSGGKSENFVVFGQVVGIHIDESIIVDGRLDMKLARPLARMGYMDYSEASEVFSMKRP